MPYVDEHPLPVRTILVSTRAAVRSHMRAGAEELVIPSVERGLELLDELAARLPEDAPSTFRKRVAEARSELATLRYGP